MENTPDSSESAIENAVRQIEQIIPGVTKDTARSVAEDEVIHSIPAPSAQAVEDERVRRAQAEDDQG